MLRRLLITIVVVGLTACGDDDAADLATDDARSDDGGLASVTLAFDQPPSDEEVEAATSVIERRLDELGLTGAAIERSGDELSVRFEPSGAVGPAEVAELLGASGRLALRPVLTTVPPDVAPACEGPNGPLTPELDDSGRHILCYDLGPAALTGEGVVTASAEESDLQGWAVALELHPGVEGLAPFNELAALCFDRAPACPTGQVAIEFDGEVMSAPSIQQPAFDERGVSIVGDFTGPEAETLAMVLRSGALPVGLTVEELRSSG